MHRDSLGNESVVEAGDVQWTSAGRGIIHSEGPTKSFIKKEICNITVLTHDIAKMN